MHRFQKTGDGIMKKIAILGSTGSIGTQTLEVVRENGDIKVLGLAAGNNIKLLEQQIREFSPKVVAVWKEEKAKELRENKLYPEWMGLSKCQCFLRQRFL